MGRVTDESSLSISTLSDDVRFSFTTIMPFGFKLLLKKEDSIHQSVAIKIMLEMQHYKFCEDFLLVLLNDEKGSL